MTVEVYGKSAIFASGIFIGIMVADKNIARTTIRSAYIRAQILLYLECYVV